jgi:hypothetical protein
MIRLRDAVIIDLDSEHELVITTDGCTGIGNLEGDLFPLEIEEVAWTACKVALMELISLGARPVGYAFNHIADLADHNKTEAGIGKCLNDFGFIDIPHISSSEKNFKVHQTTITIALTGVRKKREKTKCSNPVYVLIGEPLVGMEVLENPEKMILPEEFIRLKKAEGIYEIIPVGSHGVEWELSQFGVKPLETVIDLKKSAGPATCVIAEVCPASIDGLREIFGRKLTILSSECGPFREGESYA